MKIILTLVFVFFYLNLTAQVHSSVKINIQEKSMQDLAALGLDVYHGEYKKDDFFIGVFSKTEIDQIQNAGFEIEILIEDLTEYRKQQYHDHANHESVSLRNPEPCENGTNYLPPSPPDNFEYGSFLGYLTYQEMLDNLDSMAAKYPDLISVRSPIDTFLTYEGRPIYWVKISDNPNIDETNEPEIFYNAMHHAREPGGMLTLIYYMWHLLENYDTDPSIQNLINASEFYFVPCLNPDGFIHNVNNFNTGGNIYWRKNRRVNDLFSVGVDLNRNYGYEFGFDDTGSSPNPFSSTYRGTHGFSEAETQASRAFCNSHEFKIAINYHTYGNILIYPWGFVNEESTDPNFKTISGLMTEHTDYEAGTVFQVIGYTANGGSDDWMFGEEIEKPPIYSLTPELGLGGFYPDVSNLPEYLNDGLIQNLRAGMVLHNYPEVELSASPFLSEIEPSVFNFSIKNIGLKDGDFTVSLVPNSLNILSVGSPKIISLNQGEEIEDNFEFDLFDNIGDGEKVEFLFVVDNGIFQQVDTITKVFYLDTSMPFVDEFENNNNWTTGNWGETDEEYYSAPSSYTDSPFGMSISGVTNHTIVSEPIALAELSGHAFLTFWSKWEIEKDVDFAQVSISTDGGQTFEPQCGLYTNAGTMNQDLDQPIYDGKQEEWVKEEISLTEYIGQQILIRFTMATDSINELDGIYIDDVEVTFGYQSDVAIHQVNFNTIAVKVFPNPVKENILIQTTAPLKDARLIFYNADGKKVFYQNFKNESNFSIPSKDWADGMYFYELIDLESGWKKSGKVSVQN